MKSTVSKIQNQTSVIGFSLLQQKNSLTVPIEQTIFRFLFVGEIESLKNHFAGERTELKL